MKRWHSLAAGMALGLIPSAAAQYPPGTDAAILEYCVRTAAVGPMALALNGDGTVTSGEKVVLTCDPADAPVAPCQFCPGWQLTVQLSGNLWQVVQPPYPVHGPTIVVQCVTSQGQALTNTSPALPPGTYNMYFGVALSACPATAKNTAIQNKKFTIR